jgi:hypothetical protein
MFSIRWRGGLPLALARTLNFIFTAWGGFGWAENSCETLRTCDQIYERANGNDGVGITQAPGCRWAWDQLSAPSAAIIFLEQAL